MSDLDKRMDVTIFSHNIGTASGWDQIDNWSLIFYDFIPDAGFIGIIESGDLFVDFESGIWEVYVDEDEVLNSDSSLIELVKRYF